MPLITVIVVLVVVGAALWAINTYIPMAKPIDKQLLLDAGERRQRMDVELPTSVTRHQTPNRT